MKPPRPKIHLLDVDEPLFAFHNLIVRCGATLKNAEMKFSAAHDMSEYLLTPLGTCLQCIKEAPTLEAERHYLYGLVEAQEEKHFQSEEELEAVA